jgi:LuxR family maltose regulon positive regulatory protein
MQSSLLRTKLYRPAPALASIPRPRLLERLQEGLGTKVTLVSAPAGSGKSTLLSVWLDRLLAQSPSRVSEPVVKVSWLTLDETDKQLPRFLLYLVAAIEENYPHSCTAVTALLQENPPPPIETFADTLANCLALLPGRLVLVLDDLHFIDDSTIYTLLRCLVHKAPPAFHLVLSTRVDPPLPLTRWRARGEMNELRLHELNFTLEETTAFLEKNLARPLKVEAVTAIQKYTEGWAVGLRLAALAMRGHSDATAFLADVAANSNRYVMDYLRDDVLAQQPEAIQRFLVCTAILRRFCSSLCAAVLQIDEAEAQQQLEYVERTNLFVIDLSAPRLWVRYHHQFQSMLLTKLYERYNQQTIAVLYHQAAAWFAGNGELQEALYCLITIGDYEPATNLVEQQSFALINERRFNELAEALAFIPPQRIKQHPTLLLGAAWIHYYRSERAECVSAIQQLEQLLRERDTHIAEQPRQILECEIFALRCALDRALDSTMTLEMIQMRWMQVQPYLAQVHTDVITMPAERCQRLGDIATGLAMITTALEQTDGWSLLARCRLLNERANMYLHDCNLIQAEHDFKNNLHETQQHGFAELIALCQLGLGYIASARHQTDIAEKYLLQALSDISLFNGRYFVVGLSKLIEIYAYLGCPERAHPFVEQLKAYAQLVTLHSLRTQAAALDAYLAMACGDMTRAVAWAWEEPKDWLKTTLFPSTNRILLTRARILVAEGSSASLRLASRILRELIHYQESHHRTFFLIEALILQAATYAGLEQLDLALAALDKAVQRAVPNGAVGLFIQQPLPIKQLLYALRKQSGENSLVDILLAAFPAETRRESSKGLLEPLTARELEVLQLMAKGLSNKEIARNLVVSTNTVRNHTSNIFAKLQVKGRVQAIERVSALGLLSPPAQPKSPAQQQSRS